MITKIGKITAWQQHNRDLALQGLMSAGKGMFNLTKFLGKGTIAAVKGLGTGVTHAAKILYGGPKRRLLTIPATILGTTRAEEYFTAPAQYVNPINNRYDLDRGLLYNTYKKGPEYERYTRIC